MAGGEGTTENKMVGLHHQLEGHEFEQTSGVGDGHGSLACYSPWGCKESYMTEWLNWTLLQIAKSSRAVHLTMVHRSRCIQEAVIHCQINELVFLGSKFYTFYFASSAKDKNWINILSIAPILLGHFYVWRIDSFHMKKICGLSNIFSIWVKVCPTYDFIIF